MDMISQWVAQIIIFLLIAALIDLLIPTNTMKKYIKLVVGIILLLIFLRPIFFLFSIDIENDLESNIDNIFQEENDNESIDYWSEMQKKEIQASQDAYILEQMSQQLIYLAEDELAETFEAEITDIQFIFSDEDKTYDDLQTLVVHLRPKGEQSEMVDKVDEIVILDDHSQQDDQTDEAEDIAQLLWDIWEIDDIEISIKWEGGAN